MTKQAKIKCPHCGESIIIRQSEGQSSAEQVSVTWGAVDETFKAMEEGFKKVFDPKNWR